MGSESTYVALLRGINVGGKHCVPMNSLAELFTGCGCAGVHTYIQSGNVVFNIPRRQVNGFRASIEKKMKECFGFEVPVILRDRQQMADVVRNNPMKKLPEKTLHVYFLADQPSEDAIRSLDPDRSPGDTFRVAGSEIYLCVPNGMGRTKLTAPYFDSKLRTTCTARNWTTVQKLLELMTG